MGTRTSLAICKACLTGMCARNRDVKRDADVRYAELDAIAYVHLLHDGHARFYWDLSFDGHLDAEVVVTWDRCRQLCSSYRLSAVSDCFCRFLHLN